MTKTTKAKDMKKPFNTDFSDVASSCECTGLIPSLPMCEEELESYGEIFPVPEYEVK